MNDPPDPPDPSPPSPHTPVMMISDFQPHSSAMTSPCVRVLSVPSVALPPADGDCPEFPFSYLGEGTGISFDISSSSHPPWKRVSVPHWIASHLHHSPVLFTRTVSAAGKQPAIPGKVCLCDRISGTISESKVLYLSPIEVRLIVVPIPDFIF